MDVYVDVVFTSFNYSQRAGEGATSKARFFFHLAEHLSCPKRSHAVVFFAIGRMIKWQDVSEDH